MVNPECYMNADSWKTYLPQHDPALNSPQNEYIAGQRQASYPFRESHKSLLVTAKA